MQTGMRLLSAAVTLLVAGCANFDSPVDRPPGTEVDPAPYVGHWDLVADPGGGVPSGEELEIVNDAGDVTAIFTGTNQTAHYPVQLTNILTDTVVASVQSSAAWHIAEVSLEAGGDRLVLSSLQADTLANDVEGGVLEGVAGNLDEGIGYIGVTATGAEVRDYLENTPNIFSYETSLVFERPGGGGGAQAAAPLPAAGRSLGGGLVIAAVVLVSLAVLTGSAAYQNHRRRSA